MKKQKWLVILLSIVFTLTMFPVTSSAVESNTGKYEAAVLENGVYKITNADNLFWFAEYVNSGNPDANALVTENIAMPDDESWNGIGTGSISYSGIFDGGGKIISGLVGTDGLVKELSGTVRNVILPNASISRAGGNFGAIAGHSTGDIVNCYTSGNISGTGGSAWSVGGIVGYNQGTIKGCVSECTVSGSTTGGLVGSNYHNTKEPNMSDCLYFGTNSSLEGDKIYGMTGSVNVFRKKGDGYQYYNNGASAAMTDIYIVMQGYTAFIYAGISYTVTIPECVEIGGTATVKAENVSRFLVDSYLSVTLSDSDFTLRTDKGAELVYIVTKDDAQINVGDTVLAVENNNSGSADLKFDLKEGQAVKYSGNYTGNVTFNICIETGNIETAYYTKIRTSEQLTAFRDRVNSGETNLNAVLMNDTLGIYTPRNPE